jgi:fructose-1,6-bisphosphatase/inositol monophosphatase family enzyme
LIAVYNRKWNEVVAAVAGDIFLNRLYWGSKGAPPECLDLVTHSWFKLDGGPNPRRSLEGARVNFLTTKVSRFLSVAKQERLLKAIEKGDGRINLSWGSNMIIQVAAGYADVAVEFTKGFATYDVLPGLYLGEQAGLTILDLHGNPLTTRLDIDGIFSTYRHDPKNPARTAFVAAKDPDLAREVVSLLAI